jgi:hypothetical protein
MTQAGLAEAAGCGWPQTMLSKLEAGDYPNPGLGLVADYLRACRASFDDLRDLLGEYTAKRRPADLAGRRAVNRAASEMPVKIATEVLKYDAKVAAARRATGGEPISARDRVRRVVNLAAAADRRKRLKLVTNFLLDELDSPPGFQARVFVEQFARKVWGVLSRTRTRNQHMRVRRLARLVGDALAEHVLPVNDVRLVRDRVVELFRQMDMTGRLRSLPAGSRPRRERKPKPVDEEFERARKAMIAREASISEGLSAVMAVLQPRRLPDESGWHTWLTTLCGKAYDTLPGSPEREQVLAEALKERLGSGDAGQLAELALSGLDRQLRRAGGPT